MTTQERKGENRGPTRALVWHKDPGFFEAVTISYTGRAMPWRRASGLSRDEQAKAREGERVFIGGCPRSRGTTWREVVYRGGRYRTRIPSAAVVEAVESQVDEWRTNMEGWRRVREGVKTWDERTKIEKLMQYGPYLLEIGLPGEHLDLDSCFALAYKWDNHIPGDE